jgi:NAD(P)-dependent dehydrogenase (short-subunit alcohol dehydrogenase family)
MNVHLEGKTALVTGAARAIGQAIADTFTANGARVVYADVDFETVKGAAARSPGSLALAMDISHESCVESTVADVLKQLGRIDILVNNAGINTAKHRVNIDRFPLEDGKRS